MADPNTEPGPSDEHSRRRRVVLAIQFASLAGVIAITVAVIPLAQNMLLNPTQGYLALFTVAVVSGGLFMVPGFGWAAIGSFAIAFDNWWLPALVGTTGQVIGELYSYFLGFTGSRWILRNRWYFRIQDFMRRHGFLTILAVAAIPNPVFDIAGAVAGALGFGWYRFFAASWLGRLLKNSVIAALAILGADIILNAIGK